MLHQTVLTIDRYAAGINPKQISPGEMQRVLLAAVSCSLKLGVVDEFSRSLKDILEHLSTGQVPFAQIMHQELGLLEVLRFNVTVPTLLDFLDALLLRANADCSPGDEPPDAPGTPPGAATTASGAGGGGAGEQSGNCGGSGGVPTPAKQQGKPRGGRRGRSSNEKAPRGGETQSVVGEKDTVGGAGAGAGGLPRVTTSLVSATSRLAFSRENGFGQLGSFLCELALYQPRLLYACPQAVLAAGALLVASLRATEPGVWRDGAARAILANLALLMEGELQVGRYRQEEQGSDPLRGGGSEKKGACNGGSGSVSSSRSDGGNEELNWQGFLPKAVTP